MKLTKLSLVAAMLIGSSAFAIENTKVSGNVKLFYGTMDSDNTAGLTNAASQPSNAKTSFFDADGAYGNAAVTLELTTDLTKGVSAGAKTTYITTLGIENNLVSNTWSNAHGVTANPAANFSGGYQLDDSMYVGELWLAGTAFDTTAKIGRQSLDTPLAFTETWGIDENTFEAAVLINQSIPDTTIVGAWIGKSNGSMDDVTTSLTINALNAGQAGYLSKGGKFNTFGTDGVYAAGAINNSFEPLTVQAWYYSLQRLADAYWLQADLNIEGILAGAQYTQIDVDGAADKDEAYALMLGYAAKDIATFKAAYSAVDKKGAIGVGNVATSTRESKLYTEMLWAKGVVSVTGAKTYSLSADADVMGVGLLAAYYDTEVKTAGSKETVREIALKASKSFGPLDTSLAFIFDNYKDKNNNIKEDTNHLQVYLTYNF